MPPYKAMAKSPKSEVRRSAKPPMTEQSSVVQQEARFHHGPIPAPETLRRYDDLIPGSAATIIKMATDQVAHRQTLEREAQEHDARDRRKMLETEDVRIRGAILNERIGMVCGWLVAAGCVAGAVWSAVSGKPWQIIAAFLSLPVASIIRAFAGKK